jgi:transcriptional regulator with XRE-family HTH domain
MPKTERPLPVNPADLRRMRQEAGLSQERLAVRMGLSRVDISQWERGKRKIGLVRLCRWADAIGVDFCYDGQRVVFTPRSCCSRPSPRCDRSAVG